MHGDASVIEKILRSEGTGYRPWSPGDCCRLEIVENGRLPGDYIRIAKLFENYPKRIMFFEAIEIGNLGTYPDRTTSWKQFFLRPARELPASLQTA